MKEWLLFYNRHVVLGFSQKGDCIISYRCTINFQKYVYWLFWWHFDINKRLSLASPDYVIVTFYYRLILYRFQSFHYLRMKALKILYIFSYMKMGLVLMSLDVGVWSCLLYISTCHLFVSWSSWISANG